MQDDLSPVKSKSNDFNPIWIVVIIVVIVGGAMFFRNKNIHGNAPVEKPIPIREARPVYKKIQNRMDIDKDEEIKQLKAKIAGEDKTSKEQEELEQIKEFVEEFEENGGDK